MAISKGFIQCPESHCSEIAEVWQAGGKRSTLYTKCPACGTNQGHGEARQKYLAENLKDSIEELDIEAAIKIIDKKVEELFDADEKAAIPSENEASSVSDDTDPIPKEKSKQKPKDMPTAPPVLLGVLVLLSALITAIFATRKPSNKPKGQTV